MHLAIQNYTVAVLPFLYWPSISFCLYSFLKWKLKVKHRSWDFITCIAFSSIPMPWSKRHVKFTHLFFQVSWSITKPIVSWMLYSVCWNFDIGHKFKNCCMWCKLPVPLFFIWGSAIKICRSFFSWMQK